MCVGKIMCVCVAKHINLLCSIKGITSKKVYLSGLSSIFSIIFPPKNKRTHMHHTLIKLLAGMCPQWLAAITTQCIIIVLNDITSKSREQRLITKEHIAMHTNLILPLYTPVLSDKVVFYKILTVTL